MNPVIEKDLNNIYQIEAVNMILESLQRLTDMRISLVARIDSGSWTACAVSDEAEFGIKPGDELDLSTTY
jgi:hypothetical protein